MSEEFDDDAQDIPAAVVPKNYLINPKLLVALVVLVLRPPHLRLRFPASFTDAPPAPPLPPHSLPPPPLFAGRFWCVHFAFGSKGSTI